MHGRLLLPALFAVAVPATVGLRTVPRVRPSALKLAAIAVTLVWSLVVVVDGPVPGTAPDVRPDRHRGLAPGARRKDVPPSRQGHHRLAVPDPRRVPGRGRAASCAILDTTPRPGKDPHRLAVMMGSIGVPAWIAGHDVFIVDIGGLAEPLAARSHADREPSRRPPQAGERPAGTGRGSAPATSDAKTQAARRALQCQPIKGLIDAIDEPARRPGASCRTSGTRRRTRSCTSRKSPIVAERMYC